MGKERLFLVTILVTFSFCLGQDIGDSCRVKKTGAAGRCAGLRDCPNAIADLRNGILPTTCSFQGTVPIVCCQSGQPVPTTPPTTTTTSTTTQRPTTTRTYTGNLPVGEIAKQKCRDYSAYVYELVRPPILAASELVNVSVCGFKSVPLIVGGKKANPKEFPHQALLGYGDGDEKTWQCGGSLISEDFVLTAAHCVNSAEFGPVKHIRLGDLNYLLTNDDAGPEDFRVQQIIRHPGWKPPQQYNDIALLRMDRSVKLNKYIRPVCLNTDFKIGPTNPDSPDPRFIATGWGRIEFGGATSADLLKVVLDSFSHSQCSSSYRTTTKRKLSNGIVEASQLCAGGANEEKDTCQGDSGGPLTIYNYEVYCMYKLVGVTSFGKTCGVKGVPGVYTRVSNYIDWIEKNVWPRQ